ncbi:hypothetical protein BGX38DRAFT_263313 [Terfezia claveryi]|nr:hypothetical protein BGX38DRAFT_263313 [Terfezia claveryi]
MCNLYRCMEFRRFRLLHIEAFDAYSARSYRVSSACSYTSSVFMHIRLVHIYTVFVFIYIECFHTYSACSYISSVFMLVQLVHIYRVFQYIFALLTSSVFVHIPGVYIACFHTYSGCSYHVFS